MKWKSKPMRKKIRRREREDKWNHRKWLVRNKLEEREFKKEKRNLIINL
jgi:hypothetical protein